MSSGDRAVVVRPLEDPDVDSVNELLRTHRPWTAYETDFELSAPELRDPGEVRVGTVEGDFAGFVWWLPTGAFDRSGYLKLLGVHRSHQSAGVGTALMDAAESDVFEDHDVSDLFLLVSGFNDGARRFYEERGYVEVGPIEDYVEPGIDEVLLRKTADTR